MRNKKRKNKKIIITLLILGISIGFAALATQLSILGTANVKKQTWDVHWENVQVLPGSVDVEEPEIDSEKTTVTYTVNLDKPGDFLSFTVDAKNDGSLDAKIQNLTNLIYNSTDTTTPITKPDYIDYSITYSDGAPIKDNQLLKAGKKETYLVTVTYNENEVATEDISLKFELTLDYEMDDGTGEEAREANYCYANMNQAVPTGTVCKRAETLHQEECTNTSNSACKGSGYTTSGSKGTTTITYGTCGSKGSSPVAGDAFDCDVDGNGTFDDDERFYYISDSGTNDGYETLIYYKNVATEKYNNDWTNYSGPVALLDKLPSNEEWSNTGLNTNMTRQILNENGINTVFDGSYTLPNFTYTNRAARLLTTQEANSACGITVGSYKAGDLDSCGYLLENTTYATGSGMGYWWLETPSASYYYSVWYVDGNFRSMYNSSYADNTCGVRPVIEVDKTKIAY